ncbi:hypothetical protein [Borreliella valaisiana]|nr:hypothetical protein KJD09_04375 [Borreliella valaisiana]
MLNKRFILWGALVISFCKACAIGIAFDEDKISFEYIILTYDYF